MRQSITSILCFALDLENAQGEFAMNAVLALHALQKCYDNTTGLWPDAGWWNSVNIITVLADFDVLNPILHTEIMEIFDTTYTQAPLSKPIVWKQRSTFLPGSITAWSDSQRPQARLGSSLNIPDAFFNDYYDDEGWWALAWLRVFDITREARYLNTAIGLFNDMVGYNAPCGGIWWNKRHQSNVAISNELFLAVAIQLATRSSNGSYYLGWALRQWEWFKNSGLIDGDFNIMDEINKTTCEAQTQSIWTYTHGVIVGALVDIDTVIPHSGLATTARRIASAGMEYFSDRRGILHEPCEPDCGKDGPQFKGIFMRNMQKLQLAKPEWAQASFIERNANSIWKRDRNPIDNSLGLSWSGPYQEATAATHSSAMNAVAAAVALEVSNIQRALGP